jgi:hypothetical protein
MTDVYAPPLSGPVLERGYKPKGYVTVEVKGKPVKVSISQIKIVPPQGGTAGVVPKSQVPGTNK